MKRILFLFLLCLSLTACTDRPVPPEAAGATTQASAASTAPTRPLSAAITWMGEGDPYEIPVSLYRGEDFSLYIPDGDWILTAPDSWEYAHNDLITFRIDTYEGINARELGALLTAQGYELEYSDKYNMVTGDGMLRTVTLLEMDGHLCTFCTEYPNSTEYMEGAGTVLARILRTFLWELYN